MKERVGICIICQKEIFCLDGFLNGVVHEQDGQLYCFTCDHDYKQE